MVLSGCMDRLSRLGPPLILAAPLACVRPPLPEACPEVQAGDLALTEFRKDQFGSYRQWIELYNASDEPIALGGLRFAFTLQDGAPNGGFVIRDPDLVIEPGGYAVLGSDDPARAPYLDYSYIADWHSDTDPDEAKALPGGSLVEVLACDVLVERVVLRALGDEGTVFWPGEPDAGANDEGNDWCVDDFTMSTGLGVYGTPGEANPPCP